MKKVSYLLLISLFLSSAVTLPLDRFDFLKFKQKLSGYRECILRKRPCTKAEKATLAGVIITLLTFIAAIGIKMGRSWYQQQMALSWDGIKQLIDQYEKDVYEKLPGSQLVSFNFAVLEKFQDVIGKKELSAEEKNKINHDLNALIGGGAKQGTLQSLLTFIFESEFPLEYARLHGSFTNNLADLTPVFPKLKPKQVYQFFGLTQKEGKQRSSEDMKEVIEKKKNELQQSGNYTTDNVDLLKRQLEFYFRTPEQKKRYDAYLQGPEAVKALQITVNLQVQQAQMQNITGLLEKLQELQKDLK